jgi:hypothetical protein
LWERFFDTNGEKTKKDLQNTTQKTKDLATQTLPISEGD